MTRKIVIVGGGHAGGRLAELLVQRSGDLEVSLVGAEPFLPYERPPLSKNVLLGTAGFEDCQLWKRGQISDQIDIRLEVSAERIERSEKNVHLSDGTNIPYDQLVIATGSCVRNFSVPGDHNNGVLSLRSYADSVAVSKRLLTSENMIVVGGGFIGLEVASIAAQCGLQPKVVEASDRPLGRLVPRPIASRIIDMHNDAGVDLQFGTMVKQFLSNGRGNIQSAVLSNGERCNCDLAVIAVGVRPKVELARQAGLEVNVGIVTDHQLRTSDPNIFACGDVALFWNPLFQRHIRLESWQNAEDHARILAGVLTCEEVPCPSVPFFWSDQFDRSLQILGLPHLGSSVRVKFRSSTSLVLLHYDARDRLVGVTAFGTTDQIAPELRKPRKLIASMAKFDPAQLGHLETTNPVSFQ